MALCKHCNKVDITWVNTIKGKLPVYTDTLTDADRNDLRAGLQVTFNPIYHKQHKCPDYKPTEKLTKNNKLTPVINKWWDK